MQADLFAPNPHYRHGTAPGAARGSATSEAAAASVAPSLGQRQRAVLEIVR
jgi:hypothetical protein